MLSLAHERRNAAEYSGQLEVDERLLADVLRVAQIVLEKLRELKPPP